MPLCSHKIFELKKNQVLYVVVYFENWVDVILDQKIFKIFPSDSLLTVWNVINQKLTPVSSLEEEIWHVDPDFIKTVQCSVFCKMSCTHYSDICTKSGVWSGQVRNLCFRAHDGRVDIFPEVHRKMISKKKKSIKVYDRYDIVYVDFE
jgi:hypothetical protein